MQAPTKDFIGTAAAAGLIAAALMVLAAVFGNVGGPPPGVGAPATQAAAYYRVNANATVLSALLNGLAALLLIVFSAGLYLFLAAGRDSGWRRVGLAGTAMFATLLLAVGAVQVALPTAADNLLTARPLSLLWNAGVATLGLAAVPMLVGFGLASFESGLMPRWVGWAALVGAGAGLLAGIALASRGPLGQLLSLLAALQYPVLFAWLVGSGIAMRRRPAVGQVAP